MGAHPGVACDKSPILLKSRESGHHPPVVNSQERRAIEDFLAEDWLGAGTN